MKANDINRYLNKLRKIISKELPKDECKDILEYYEEYFADAGFETEADIVNELGSPEALAKKILEEHSEKIQNERMVYSDKKGLSLGWVIFIAIIGSPLWIALFGIAIGLGVTLLVLPITFGAVALGLSLAGIGVIVGGIVLLFTDVLFGIYILGCAFILCAVGLIFVILTMLFVKLGSNILNSIKNKKKPKINFD